jgi:hypothetical protein
VVVGRRQRRDAEVQAAPAGGEAGHDEATATASAPAGRIAARERGREVVVASIVIAIPGVPCDPIHAGRWLESSTSSVRDSIARDRRPGWTDDDAGAATAPPAQRDGVDGMMARPVGARHDGG